MKKVLVLNSGGLDSAIMCKKLHDEGFDVVSLYVGSNSIVDAVTKVAAQETATRYCSKHIVHELDFGGHSDYLVDINTNESWMYDEAVSNGKWQDYLDKQGVGYIFCPIPVHSWTYLSIALIYAFKEKITEVYVGYDNIVYSTEYRDLFQSLSPNGNWSAPTADIMLPLIEMNGYAEELQSINTPASEFSYTHSCRQPIPCGFCDKCTWRQEVGL